MTNPDIDGTSSWRSITLEDVRAFGVLTDDVEPLHTDPEWCAQRSPYGVPIAYGFQTLALLTAFLHDVTANRFRGGGDGGFPLNYGFDRMRLIEPVRVGDRIRAVFRSGEASERASGRLIPVEVTVEIEDRARPALVGTWLFLWSEGQPA